MTRPPSADIGPSPAPPGPVATAFTTALLRWAHRRGGTAHALARVRLLAPALHDPPRHAYVVLSELRDNPAGRGITADVPGAVAATLAHLLPAGWPLAAVSWYVHHGAFSTYDVAGADTYTRLAPRAAGPGPDPVITDDVHDHQLLPPPEAAALVAQLALRPVEEELRRWPTPPPAPAAGTG